jgi:hypothetical protein
VVRLRRYAAEAKKLLFARGQHEAIAARSATQVLVGKFAFDHLAPSLANAAPFQSRLT